MRSNMLVRSMGPISEMDMVRLENLSLISFDFRIYVANIDMYLMSDLFDGLLLSSNVGRWTVEFR